VCILLIRNRVAALVAVFAWLGNTACVNFLAHLVLAPQTPEGLIGSIAPDMIRGPLPADLRPAVMASAKEHYRIDRFTDTHRSFGKTRERLSELVDSRLSGVLADVLYDHVLARDWANWRSDDFPAFIDQTQQHLLEALSFVPVRMQMIVRKMIDEQWLTSYATAEGICARLETMSQRLTRRLDRPTSLRVTERDIADQDASLCADFAEFWPDLLAHVDQGRVASNDRLAS
jgi:acyl carrier protein phosphodiesterase